MRWGCCEGRPSDTWYTSQCVVIAVGHVVADVVPSFLKIPAETFTKFSFSTFIDLVVDYNLMTAVIFRRLIHLRQVVFHHSACSSKSVQLPKRFLAVQSKMAASASVETFFNGKTVLVTGAGQGIGRALSKKLVSCGAKVLAVSRTASHLNTLKEEMTSDSGRGSVEIHSIDLAADWNKTKELLGELAPRVDCLVNSAGMAILEPFLEMKERSFDVLMNVNVKAMINVSQEVCKAMIARGHHGTVVNISSLASKLAVTDHIAYCATKGAVDMVTQVMALEMGKHKIRVNAVNPTVVMTAMGKYAWSDPAKANPMLARIPLGKFVEEADVVNTIMFLLSDQCQMINGTCIFVDGGLSCW